MKHLLACLGCALLAAACGESTTLVPASATSGAGGSSSATGTTSSTATTTTTGAGGATYGHPESIPDGWLPWVEWDVQCPFWLPPDEVHMPAPITWQPCVAETQTGIACREMVTDWLFGFSGPITQFPRFDVGPDGRPYLLLTRLAYNDPASSAGYVEWVVGDVDGPLAFAMRLPSSKPFTCGAQERGIRGGRFVLRLVGDGETDAIDSTVDGALIGEIGSLLPVLRRRDESSAQSSWSIGAGWVERTTLPGGMFLHSPDFTEERLLYNPATDPDGLPGNTTYPTVIGKSLIFEVGNLGMSGIMAYDEATGTHPLVRWYGDTSQGAANVGTDGVDIVWTYGEGKGPGEFVYPTLSIMTAPFTTDASKLQPKRLRSDPSPGWGTSVSAFTVGCGFAGHLSLPNFSVIIVRLSDGQSWQLDPSNGFGWGPVLGFTCEEAFLLAYHDKHATIARVRLDSLGPGLAPD